MGKPDLSKGFLLYKDYINPVSKLSDAAAGRLFKAILSYINGQDLPELGQIEETAFCFIKSQIDIDMEAYKKRCAVNAANGAKGGRPRKVQIVENVDKDVDKNSNLQETEEATQISEEQAETKTKEKQKPKQSKKQASKKKYAEFVSMTEAEHEKIIDRFGEPAAVRMIEILDNYKGQSGRKYASDYRAILNWVSKRYEEERSGRRARMHDTGHVDTDADWQRFYQEGYRR